MGYGIDIEIFEKITFEGIKSNEETFKFLKDQACEILKEEREKWEDDQETDEDRKDPELWYEYESSAEKKFEKYLTDWFDDIGRSICLTPYEKKLPWELVSIFDKYIDEIYSRISFEELAMQIVGQVFEEQIKDKGV